MNIVQITISFVDERGHAYYKLLEVPTKTTLRQAIVLSEWLHLPEFEWLNAWLIATNDDDIPKHMHWHVGIFSQKKRLGDLVMAGDRVEIYRQLRLDPMRTRHAKVKIHNKQTAKNIQAKNIAKKAEKLT